METPLPVWPLGPWDSRVDYDDELGWCRAPGGDADGKPMLTGPKNVYGLSPELIDMIYRILGDDQLTAHQIAQGAPADAPWAKGTILKAPASMVRERLLACNYPPGQRTSSHQPKYWRPR